MPEAWKHGGCLHKRSREEEVQTARNAIIAWRHVGSTEIEHCNSALLTEEDHNINTTSLEDLGILGMDYSFQRSISNRHDLPIPSHGNHIHLLRREHVDENAHTISLFGSILSTIDISQPIPPR